MGSKKNIMRPSVYKKVIPTFEKIHDLDNPKTLLSSSKFDWLINNPIQISKSENYFSCELEDRSSSEFKDTINYLDEAFDNCSFSNGNISYTFNKGSIKKINLHLAKGIITGTLCSIIEGIKTDYNNKYLRLIQPLSTSSFIGRISNAIDLKTDQQVMYGAGLLKLQICNLSFDIFRVSENNNNYIFIDSNQPMVLDEFEKITSAFFLHILIFMGFYVVALVILLLH